VILPDSPERYRSLEPGCNFHLETPVGSGKTTMLLTARFLRLLGMVDHPQNVLAMTFTNKAAGEMQERVARFLPSPSRVERIYTNTAHPKAATKHSPQSLMFLRNTRNKEKALLRGLHYGAWDLLTRPRHFGRVPRRKLAGTSFGPESRQLELRHAASLDSGQKHAGMTAWGVCKSPSRDFFSEQLLMPLRGT
jgi:hypothetical protein